MAEDLLALALPEPEALPLQTRHDRPGAMGFVTDAQSEAALREGLSDALPEGIEIRRGGVRAAISAQQRMATPHVLVVDVSGEEQPLSVLARLSEVVEPETCVLVIGEGSDLALYRDVTRELGAAEYLAKPLTRDLVARYFGPLVHGQAAPKERMLGGRFVAVTGVRGGVGASVLAASLAWQVGPIARRHTVLLDADLHFGTAAFMLNAESGTGLREALETPERIDALLAERAARPVTDRLHVLSCQEAPGQLPDYAPGAAAQLLEALRRRYNLIVGDVPWRPLPLCHDLLAEAHQRVLVMTPTLAAVRDALRLLPPPEGGVRQQRATLVLNRLGMPGGLKRAQIEDALRLKVDLTIPDLPRQISGAVTLGEPALSQGGAFRSAIRELAHMVGGTPATEGAGAPPGRLRRWFGGRR